jgi:N-acetylglutamate synthase-like GNAT family acetyltransferase
MSQAPMQVRRAQARDGAAIQTLYTALVPGDENIAVDPDRVAALEADPLHQLYVVEVAGSISGTAFLTICLDVMYGAQPYAVLENVIVASSVQRQGAGRALMAAVEQAARAARRTKLMLLSSSARSGAHAFFTRLGFDGARKRGFVKYLNRPA